MVKKTTGKNLSVYLKLIFETLSFLKTCNLKL